MKLSDTFNLEITVGEAIRIYALLGKSNGEDRHYSRGESLYRFLRRKLDPSGAAYQQAWASCPDQRIHQYWSRQQALEEAVLQNFSERAALDEQIKEAEAHLQSLKEKLSLL